MSCPFFFVSRQPKDGCSQVQVQTDLHESLKNISDQIKKDGVYVPEVLRPLLRCTIVETVVGPTHIAFRLQDGRVCRVSYSLRADKLASNNDKRRGRSSDSRSESLYNRDANSGSIRVPGASVALRTLRTPMSVLGRSARSLSLFREMQRQGIYLARPLSSQIPASDVPENLIEQCQTVLQGKSRQLIIRELQRTNLDVNMAVNNLLSRDDEADLGASSGTVSIGEDWEDEAEDLFSLFEHPERHLLLDGESGFTDDLIDRPSSPRFRRELSIDYDRSLGDHAAYTDRRKRRRLDTHAYLRNSEAYSGRSAESRRFWRSVGLPSDDKGIRQDEDAFETTNTGKNNENNVQLGDNLEFWPTNSAESVGCHFVSIAALYTELVAVNSQGELHQWKWQSSEPFNPHSSNSPPFNLMDQSESGAALVNHRHPRASSLGIAHEKVVSLSGCITRASIMTATGAIASWMDEVLPCLLQSAASAPAAAAAATSALMRLEHPAMHFGELKAETVTRVLTAPLITVVQCASGAVFWWGVLPSYIRQRNAEKQKHPISPVTSTSTAANTSITSTTRHRVTSSGSDVGSKTTSTTATAATFSLGPGDLVCMKNAPVFHAGAIGFTLVNGVPKVGVLLEDAWKLTDVCRFRVKSPSAIGSGTTKNPLQSATITIATPSEAVHALTCPYAQAAAAAQAAAQTEPDPPPVDSGALEMPPPPSPASSTCSDQSGPVKVSPGTFKRKKAPSTSSDGGGGGGSASAASSVSRRQVESDQCTKSQKQTSKASHHDEEIEDWCLNEVVFVEDGRTQPVGVLLKVDGAIAAVKFLKEQDRACLAARCPAAPVCLFINQITKSTGQKSSTSSASLPLTPHDPMSWLNDCRLLKKDDLMLVKQPIGGGLPQRVPDFVQHSPRNVPFSFLGNSTAAAKQNHETSNVAAPRKRIIALAPENCRLHAIVDRMLASEGGQLRGLEYHVFTLNGKTVSSRRLPALSKAPPSDGDSSFYSHLTLTCPAERPLLVRDSNGVVFPFLPPSRPGQESWVFPSWLGLPPVQCAALAWISPPARHASVPLRAQRDGDAPAPPAVSRPDKNSVSASSSARQPHPGPRILLGVVVIAETSLLQHILRADETKVEETLRSLNGAPPDRAQVVLSEMADGHRSVLHMAVLMCAPTSRETPELAQRLEGILKQDSASSSSAAADGSGWTTIAPSSPPPPPPPRSLHSLLNLSATSGSRSAAAGGVSSGLTVHDLFIRSPLEAAGAAASTAPTIPAGGASDAAPPSLGGGSGHFCHLPPLSGTTDEVSRRLASHRILRALLLHPRLRPFMSRLLAGLSDDGLTPFMLAVQCKAYQVANFLLDYLCDLEGIRCDGSEEVNHQFRYSRLMPYIYPPSARLDDSPLFTLCYNDNCSFTWTGPNHIRQDIFECRTCGLMDSLCCCSECARVCHKGHDCRLKRTSPTAYCDCWEKCRCRSLVLGHQASRLSLFQRLLLFTDLVYLPNRSNEHLMVYLTRCVERQTREQKQYKSSRRRGGGGERVSLASNLASRVALATGEAASSLTRGGGGGGGNVTSLDEPEHDLEPPTFSRDALELVLDSRPAAASLLCDSKSTFASEPFTRFADRKGKSAGYSVMAIQSGTSQLDDFVFTLLCKCPPEFLVRLVNTLACSLSDHLMADRGLKRLLALCLHDGPVDNTDAYFYCQRGVARFIRSVARVYTSLVLELTPDHYKRKSRLTSQVQPLELSRFVFFHLAPVALPELTRLAVNVLAPVRTGALRSTALFNLTSQQSEAIHGFDQVLAAERTSSLRRQTLTSASAASANNSVSGGGGGCFDCPNSVVRRLMYGCDSAGSGTLLPSWCVLEQQTSASRHPKPPEGDKLSSTSDIAAFTLDEPMDIDSASQDPAPRVTDLPRRRRRHSQGSGSGGGNRQSPSPKRRRRRRRRNRRNHGNSDQSPSHQPAPQATPVIVVEQSATTTSTASSDPFAEMQILSTAGGDSDTDADVRSNELDSNTTTVAAASNQTAEEEEEYSGTESEEEGDSDVGTHSVASSGGGRTLLLRQPPQIEASGSQHSSVSSTAATAGTAGSIIMDMESSLVASTSGNANTSQQEFITTYPPEQSLPGEQQSVTAENTALDDDTMVATMFCASDDEEEAEVGENDENDLDETLPISELGLEEEIDRGSRLHPQNEEDDVSDEDEEEIDDDEDVGVEEEEDSEDDGGDSEDDEEEDEDEEEDDEDETEEEEEDERERQEEKDDEEEDEPYSPESEPSPPPSPPSSPWTRLPVSSSATPATVSTDDVTPQTTTTAATATTSTAPPVARGFSASASTSTLAGIAHLYAAALSSSSERRGSGRNSTLPSRYALAGMNLLSAPLSPPRSTSGNTNNSSTNAAATTTTNAISGVTPATGSAPVPTTTETTGGATEGSDGKKCGIHVTQVHLSRAFACLLRLIADVMVDLVHQGGDIENGCSISASLAPGDLRRCFSAPVLLNSALVTPLNRQLNAINRTGQFITPFPPTMAARIPDTVEQATVCAAAGFILAPIWAWLVGALDSLEARLRCRARWTSKHAATKPSSSTPTDSTASSLPGRRKDAKSDRTGTASGSGFQQSPLEGNESAPAGGSGSNSSNRQHLLAYLLSVMRTATNDHGDAIPPVDVASHKHTAYLIDAFLYFFKVFESTWPAGLVHHLIHLRDGSEEDDDEVGEEAEREVHRSPRLFHGRPLAGRNDAYFRRSASTLSLAGAGLDPVLSPVADALPLAVAPHQLQPNSRRSELFGITRDIHSDVFDLLPSRPHEKDGGHNDEASSGKAVHYSRIGKLFKDSSIGRQIVWGGEFLDVCGHAGLVLSRWCTALDAFTRAFPEDVGAEHRSYMVELARFPEKEARFRKEMERLRNASRRDLTLEVEREPNALLISTVRQLNAEFSHRFNMSPATPFFVTKGAPNQSAARSMRASMGPSTSSAASSQPPNLSPGGAAILACHRLKVTFKDEPGEGSGVARSFITAFSEAVLTNLPLPDLSPLMISVPTSCVTSSSADDVMPPSSLAGDYHMAATSRLLIRLGLPQTLPSTPPSTTTSTTTTAAAASSSSRPLLPRRSDSSITVSRALFRTPVTTSSISFNLSTPTAPPASVEGEAPVALPSSDVDASDIAPELRGNAASSDGNAAGTPASNVPSFEGTKVPENSNSVAGSNSSSGGGGSESAERAPLFWQPGLAGFYSPRAVSCAVPRDSPELYCRLSIYRCVGRVIGLCLLFNETCPLRFNRHVLKYILGRPLCWHDFAFYNTTVYEGLRQLLLYTTSTRPDGESDSIRDYNLTFSLMMAPEEGGSSGASGPQQHPLAPGGEEIDVDSEKIYEFVKRYTEFKMWEVIKEPLEQLRLGVFDMLPTNALDGLTAEDLRLLLNGIWDVDVDLLVSYTTFLDESGCSSSSGVAGDGQPSGTDGADPASSPTATERVARLKRWFWHVVRGMDTRQRQDLLYFWTSSPALPASAQGFAPMPTIMIRPADDQHLPTANTCISRLYLPLYSSKQVLREKLLQAIETRSFGFV
uniref:HECT domain-containing protein n=3 Tax=Mesocestoides corti TaxID=53468 RepID=A0A5K3FCE0_MESCO